MDNLNELANKSERGTSVPVQTVQQIKIFDNHDESYHYWKEMGFGDMSVVHVDAHHDLFTRTGMNCPSIGDFLRWALREGIAGGACWVIPSPAFQTPKALKNVRDHMKMLARSEGAGKYSFDAKEHLGTVTLYGRKVTACSISSLPRVDDPFLLDIDTDFMITPEPPLDDWQALPEKPWIWPDELATQLSDLAHRAQAITICYSVSGGYTPLRWKHLGDDLAAILQADCSPESLTRAKEKRLMTEALVDGELTRHNEVLEHLLTQYPEDASLHYWKGIGLLHSGDPESARSAVARAIELDPAYASSAGFSGLVLEGTGDYTGAERMCRESVELNESDAVGWHVLGRLASRKGDLKTAQELILKAVSIPAPPAEAHRDLGLLLEAESRFDEAIMEYIRYLRGAFSGRSIEQVITTRRDPSYKCLHWAEGYTALGRVYAVVRKLHLAGNCNAAAMKIMNPRLYQIAGPFMWKMTGSEKYSTSQAALAITKATFYGLGMGIKGLGRKIKQAWLYRNGVPMARACPPIIMGKPTPR